MKLPRLLKIVGMGLASCLFVSSAHAGAVVGEAAPDFTLKNLDGAEVKLAEFADKIVVLEWTNFLCPFVKKHYENGDMPALQKKYRAKGVVWLAVSSGPEGKQGNFAVDQYRKEAEARTFAADHLLLDRSGEVGKQYGATNTPHMFVINRGKLVYAGAIDSIRSAKSEDVAKADNYVAMALDEILAGKAVSKAKTKPYGCGVKY